MVQAPFEALQDSDHHLKDSLRRGLSAPAAEGCEPVHSVTVDNKFIDGEGLSPATKLIAIIPSMSASPEAARRIRPSDGASTARENSRIEGFWAIADLRLTEHASLDRTGPVTWITGLAN